MKTSTTCYSLRQWTENSIFLVASLLFTFFVSTRRVRRLLPILLCHYGADFSQLSIRPRVRSQKTGFLFAWQRALNKTGVIFLVLQIKTNSCTLNSTCKCDKLGKSACGFYWQKVINFINKCGGIEPCFKPRGSVKRRCHLFFNL